MLELDLDQRVGDEFRAVVDGLEPSPRLDGLVCRRIRRRERLRRLTQGGGGALALALIIGVVAAVHDKSTNTSVEASAEAGPDGQPLFLVPGAVPAGMELVDAVGGDQPGVASAVTYKSDWAWTQRWTHLDAQRHVSEIVDVQWGPKGAVPHPLGNATSVPIPVRGEEGDYADNGLLSWDDPSGLTVKLSGSSVVADGASRSWRETLTSFAEGLVPRPDGGFDVPTPPEGFELAGEWPGTASEGSNQRALVYRDEVGRWFQLHLIDDSDLPPAMSLGYGDARLDEEFGPGVVTPRLAVPPTVEDPDWLQFAFDADLYLQWEEASGTRVTISGVGLTEAELRAIARGLEPVDAETWFALQGRSDAEDHTTASSTAPDPDPEGTAPTGAPGGLVDTPVAGATQYSGTYEGTEFISLSATASCDVDSVLDSTFTLTDASTWLYHSDYCGVIRDDIWSSSGGTFTFTLPDGATLTGTMLAQSVPVDSDGEPFELAITGGTGSHPGATGSCQLDNHLTDVAPFVQEQSGSFTCSIL